MVELIVVMLLVGILGAIGAARFFDRRDYDAASFAEQARALMRYGQKLAIARDSKTQRLYVRFDGQSASLCFDAACANHVPAPYTVSKDANCNSTTWYCVSRPPQASYTVTLGAMSTAAPQFISFDALGRPYDSAGNALSDTMTLTVTAGSSSVLVNVDPETGYVR